MHSLQLHHFVRFFDKCVYADLNGKRSVHTIHDSTCDGHRCSQRTSLYCSGDIHDPVPTRAMDLVDVLSVDFRTTDAPVSDWFHQQSDPATRMRIRSSAAPPGINAGENLPHRIDRDLLRTPECVPGKDHNTHDREFPHAADPRTLDDLLRNNMTVQFSHDWSKPMIEDDPRMGHLFSRTTSHPQGIQWNSRKYAIVSDRTFMKFALNDPRNFDQVTGRPRLVILDGRSGVRYISVVTGIR